MRIIVMGEVPYQREVALFFLKNFPLQDNTKCEDVVDVLTDELVGSKNTRYGSRPNPELLVAIRTVIREAIRDKLPIPINTPWGSMKPDESGIDVAEVSALKQLHCLNERVSRYYDRGIAVSLDIEDSGAKVLFGRKPAIIKYATDLRKLIRILGYNFILPRLESTLMDESKFFDMVTQYQPVLFQALDGDANAINIGLKEIGWSGNLPQEQIKFYTERYEKLYPGEHPLDLLATYFAQALARYRAGGRSNPGTKFIKLSFVQPIPGVPDKGLFYRTVPMKYGQTHIPPWRAKGYLKIDEESAVPSVTNFNHNLELLPAMTEFTDEAENVVVQSDYLVLGK